MRTALLVAVTILVRATWCRVADMVAQPLITPAPEVVPRQLGVSSTATGINALSLAQVLITAVPESLRMIAATNLPEASKILWSEFLDGKKPSWFTGLPTDVQTYLVNQFAPSTSRASSTSSASTSAASQSATAAAVTVSVTTTAGAKPTSGSDSGLTDAGKIGIGLGVLAALLAITVLILACCLARVTRRNRRLKKAHVDSRPPTPAFLSSTMVPKPTTSIRGGSGSGTTLNDGEVDGNPFEDPAPAAALGAKRHSQGSRHSYGPLTPVSEEAIEHDHPAEMTLPARSSLRRSRGSIVDPNEQFMAGIDRHDPHESYGGQVYSPGPSIYPTFEARDWHAQHPALRSITSTARPHGPTGVPASNITRKPVAAPSGYNAGTSGHRGGTSLEYQHPDDFGPSRSEATRSQSGHGDWPLGRSSKDSGNSYWKINRPNYDRYERE